MATPGKSRAGGRNRSNTNGSYHTAVARDSGTRYSASMPGKVWLVGAGPGDPGLITVRGQAALAAAEVVLHDALSHPDLLTLCPQAEIRDVGKRYGQPNPDQQWICAQLIELARAGRRVVRLKGGDPFLFARGAEEALALHAAGIPFEVVPGISSPVAASAYAGFSLTHRGLSSSVTFITGSDREAVGWSPEAWHRLATSADTICVLMGMRRLEQITDALVAGGRSAATPAAVVYWGARPEQRVVEAPLGEIAATTRAAGLTNPAILFVGEVVKLRGSARWYDNQPLFGKRVLVPRPAHQAEQTAHAIRARAAEPVVHPVVEIRPPPDPAALTRVVTELACYDWVVFTSANGVTRTWDEIERQGRDARAFGTARVAAIGPKTAEALADRGLRADLVAREYVAESLRDELLARGVPRQVALLRAFEARNVLPDALRTAGTEVTVVAAYQTVPVIPTGPGGLAERLTSGQVDVVLLTSGAIAHTFFEALGKDAIHLLQGVALASIGPITSQAIRRFGVEPTVEAETYTVEGLLDALEAHYCRVSM